MHPIRDNEFSHLDTRQDRQINVSCIGKGGGGVRWCELVGGGGE